MDLSDTPGRIGRLAWTHRLSLVATLIYLLLAWFACVQQAGRSKILFYPDGFLVPDAEWSRNDSVRFEMGSPGKVYTHSWRYSPVMTRSATNSFAPALYGELPYSRTGYSLIFVIDRFSPEHPPRCQVAIESNTLTHVTLPHGLDTRDDAVYTEFPIPASMLNVDAETTVRVTNLGGAWGGSLLFVRYLPLRRALAMGLPIAAALVLLLLACQARRAHLLHTVVLALCVAPLFYYTLFFAKLSPAGTFFSDSSELFNCIRFNDFTYDMKKHPLFLPVVSMICRLLRYVADKPLKTTACAFTVIASLNVGVAWYLLVALFKHKLLRAAVLVCYVFSFVILTYSAIYETYMLTTLIVNIAALAIVRGAARPSFPRTIGTASLLAASVLASLQTCFLLPSAVAAVAWRGSLRRAAMLAVLTIAAAFILLQLIAAVYDGGLPACQGRPSIAATYRDTHEQYAKKDNLTLPHLGSVLKDTAVTAFVNTRQVPYARETTGRGDTVGRIVNVAASVTVIALLLSAAWGLARTPLKHSWPLHTLHLSILAYALFHWYFNPTEMLLYAAPIVLPLLALEVGLSARAIGPRHACVLVMLLGILELTALSAATHRQTAGLRQTPCTDAPIVILGTRARNCATSSLSDFPRSGTVRQAVSILREHHEGLAQTR